MRRTSLCAFGRFVILFSALSSAAGLIADEETVGQQQPSDAGSIAPASKTGEDEEDPVKAAEEWRRKHEARFCSPDGWLALVGMTWLRDGQYRVGTGTDCDIVLPQGTAESLALTLKVSGAVVNLQAADRAELLINGAAADHADLVVEGLKPEADCPDQVQLGSRIRLQLVRRSGRLALRIRDARSPSILSFPGKTWFPIAAGYRVEGAFTRFETPRTRQITNIRGEASAGEIAGVVRFQLDGQELELIAQEEKDGALFLAFRDRTSGVSTYSPGRFLDTDAPVDGRVILDFNRCYSPPCAWSAWTLCPLPLPENHLPVSIEAGERDLRDAENK
jgi:uncharacterized protein